MSFSNNPHSVGINQNQAGSTYPFLSPCVLTGVVSDIHFTFPSGDKPTDVTAEIYPSDERPRLLFRDNNNKLLADTDNLELDYKGDSTWFFHSGQTTVRYSEYANANHSQALTEPTRIVPRCWAATDIKISSGFSVELENPLAFDFSKEGNLTTIRIFDSGEKEERLPGIITINGLAGNRVANYELKGDDGNLVVTALVPAGESVPDVNERATGIPNGLGIRNDGQPCCSCNDYAARFRRLNLLVREHNYQIAYLQYLKDYYDALLTFYYETVEERLSDLVTLRATPGVKQTMFTIGVANPIGQSVFNVEVIFRVSCAVRGRTRAVYIDNAYSEGDYPEYKFTIPELRGHDQWSGSIAITFLECGHTATGSLTTSLPWFEGTVTAVGEMDCDFNGRSSVKVSKVKQLPTAIPLPEKPRRSDFFD